MDANFPPKPEDPPAHQDRGHILAPLSPCRKDPTGFVEGDYIQESTQAAVFNSPSEKVTAGMALDKHYYALNQRFSIFLTLRPFNTVPQVVMILNHKISFIATS